MFNFNGKTARLIARRPLVSVTAVKRNDFRDVGKWPFNRCFSVTWLAAVQISWNKRKFHMSENPGLPQDCFRYTNMAAVSLFYTPIWLPWRHVKTIFRGVTIKYRFSKYRFDCSRNMDRCVLTFKKKKVYFFYPFHPSTLKTSNLPTKLPGQQDEY